MMRWSMMAPRVFLVEANGCWSFFLSLRLCFATASALWSFTLAAAPPPPPPLLPLRETSRHTRASPPCGAEVAPLQAGAARLQLSEHVLQLSTRLPRAQRLSASLSPPALCSSFSHLPQPLLPPAPQVHPPLPLPLPTQCTVHSAPSLTSLTLPLPSSPLLHCSTPSAALELSGAAPPACAPTPWQSCAPGMPPTAAPFSAPSSAAAAPPAPHTPPGKAPSRK